MASDEILAFLQEHYRPFTFNDIQQNVSKTHAKSVVQKALDKLVDKDKVIEKTYGKQKVYCIQQPPVANLAKMGEQSKAIDREINEASANLASVEEKFAERRAELRALQSRMTIEDARATSEQMHRDVAQLEQRLKHFETNSEPVDEAEKNQIYADFDRYVKEYKRRKKLCMEMVNAIMENYPKSKSHLFESVGIETDEDAEFVLKV